MRSYWANLINTVIPSNASTNEPRIVIGPQLPPPLDTYIPPGSAAPYVGGIIWYGGDDDTNYYFQCEPNLTNLVNDGAADWQSGRVINGAVVVSSTGVIQGIREFSVDPLGPGTVRSTTRIAADTLELLADRSDDTGVITLRAGGAEVSVEDDFIQPAFRLTSGTFLDYGGSSSVSGTAAGALTTTNVAYALLGNVTPGAICGQSFVAPPSGAIVVLWRTGIDNTTAANSANCTWELRTGATVGSGAVVHAATDAEAISMQGTDGMGMAMFDTLGGLTPGDTYNVSLWQRSSNAANTAAFANRKVAVLPAL